MTDVASRWVKVLDQTRCIGCHACTTACKSENEVPVGVTRTYVKSVDVGIFPTARRAFQVTRCNQCEDPPCVEACPTGAMYRRPDGIVDFDKRVCIGCKACMAACPYDAIFINPDDHSAEKCNFCAHRLDVGLEPACVVVCPTEAITVGDLADPTSKVAKFVHRSPVAVRRPEKETQPGVFYRGAGLATLDPLGAARPTGGIYAWAGQGPGSSRRVGAGHPHEHNSSAAAIVSYDVPHKAPWDWRVSLYTWTKGISAGAYLAPLVLVLAGRLAWSSALFRWAGPAVALAMLAITGAILVWDLEHPWRFWMLFVRPQWRSWLVRGGVIISAYGAALVAALGAGAAGSVGAQEVVAGFALPLAALAAGYTAYLFAQARGRDLWQSQLLAPHLLAQSLMVGAAALFIVGTSIGTTGVGLADLLAATAALHLFMVAGEAMPRHPTAHAHMAVTEMVHGRFAGFFWVGLVLSVVAVFSPWIGPVGAVAALLGIAGHKHAYVQAGQSVPLA
ncbi:MAG: 4Fe-4S dicluster domain-containing protein [Acidimicrobiales bacterium]